MIKKYVSDFYNANALKSNKLNVIYAPMGSGKTHLFKELMDKHSCLMIAPYRSSREDFGLGWNFNKNKTGLDYQFLYTGNLIEAVTKDWEYKVDLTNDKAIEKATQDYVNNLPPVSFTHILFDEVDFMWIQASMTWVGNNKLKTSGGKIWEYILKALATKFTLIGQSSTRIPTVGIVEIGVQILTEAHTSVRFDNIIPILVHKDVTHCKLFKTAMERSMDEADQRPTLVFKRKYSATDISYMGEMVKQSKRVLVVLREENSPKLKAANQLLIDVLTEIGAVEATADNITLQATQAHFKIVGDGAGLDQITPSLDPYEFYDYIFVNTSSSRQVSLKAVCGDTETKVRVITIDNKLNSTTHQVAGRFRENRVDIIHYLKGYKLNDVPEFSDLKLWGKLLNIDPVIRSYMTHTGVIGQGGLSGPVISKQFHRDAEWIGKSAKGKAVGKNNQKSLHKLNVLSTWYSSGVDLEQTKTALLASYSSYCKANGETPYLRKTFSTKLDEANNKKASCN